MKPEYRPLRVTCWQSRLYPVSPLGAMLLAPIVLIGRRDGSCMKACKTTMERRLRQVSGITLLFVTAGLLAGCTRNLPAQVGIITRGDFKSGHVKLGDPAPEFSYRTEEGKVKRLSDLRGQVILVLFRDDPDWPDCQHCHQFEQLASQLSCAYATVSVVSIATPDKPCEDAICAVHQCKVKGYAQLIALCDRSGRIRELYGPNAIRRFFVIDVDGSIRAKGALDDMEAIERTARIVVSEHVFDYYKTDSCIPGRQASRTAPSGGVQVVLERHAEGSESHAAE